MGTRPDQAGTIGSNLAWKGALSIFDLTIKCKYGLEESMFKDYITVSSTW